MNACIMHYAHMRISLYIYAYAILDECMHAKVIRNVSIAFVFKK